ncbi:hypothetical protein GCM10018965_058570 [Nonomuraea roseola]
MHLTRRVASAEPLPRMMIRLQDGVQWRTMIGRSSLLDLAFLASCTTLHRAGDRHRVTAQPIQAGRTEPGPAGRAGLRRGQDARAAPLPRGPAQRPVFVS